MMKTITTWKHGHVFKSALQSHHILLNSGKDDKGNALGFNPKALLLSALAGCSGIDVVDILKKMKVNFNRLEITTEADQTEKHPRVFKDITIKYVSDVSENDIEKLRKAVELSLNKYCGVAAMLRKNSNINYYIECI